MTDVAEARQPKPKLDKRGKEIDFSLLSAEDKTRLAREAQAKILAERKKAAEEAYLDEAVAKERAKHDPALEIVDVLIDLPAFTAYLLINGVYYQHGSTVAVTREEAASIREMMARAWNHEQAMGNPNMNQYKPVKQRAFSAASVGTESPSLTSSQFARV